MTTLITKLNAACEAAKIDPKVEKSETRAALNEFYRAVLDSSDSEELKRVHKRAMAVAPEVIRQTLTRMLADRPDAW